MATNVKRPNDEIGTCKKLVLIQRVVTVSVENSSNKQFIKDTVVIFEGVGHF